MRVEEGFRVSDVIAQYIAHQCEKNVLFWTESRVDYQLS